MSAPEIGVLVPVRLETRFVRPGRGRRWRLRLRVVPDAVSITNHDERASMLELDAVEAMWRTAGGEHLETPDGRRAWRSLVAAVGAERAAWLARTFPPAIGSHGELTIVRPDETRTKMRAPRVMGLPPTMEIWIARRGQRSEHAATLTVVGEDIALDLDDPDSTRKPWWTSFDEAVRVGLAAEIDLGTMQPTDIDAVFVVGIGGGDPGPLLSAQADSGRLGIVPPGSPTSSVNGEPALSLGDADVWRRLVPMDITDQAGTAALSTALTGAPTLRGIVGGERNHRPLNRALVGALWPALWGHSLANVWGYAEQTDELGLWAADNLVPEGPLPSMRIENLPYGLLPATSVRRWRRAAGDPAIESRLVPLVRELVATWAEAAEGQAAEQQGNVLRDLVRNPTAARYAWRWMVPTTLAHAVSFRYNQRVAAAELGSWWTRQAELAPKLDPTAVPARQLVSVGWSHDIEMGLAEPSHLPSGTDVGGALSRLAAAPVTELLAAGRSVPGRGSQPPWGTSVLTELARHSLLASAAVVARRSAGQARVVIDPVSVDERTPTETEIWAAQFRPTDVRRRGDAAVAVHRNVIAGLETLAGEAVADIDRGLRAALDTATNRVDPWATAIAWRRLQDLAATPRTLGVYGWVDAPRPRASDSDHRYVLAPSTDQATVAAILRDRALRDPDADRWQMDLTSDAVRGALRLADETREGAHPAESLGRRVEAIVNRPDVIDRLRAEFPSTRAVGFGFSRTDLRIRRVCDGMAVLDAAESRPSELSQLGVRPAQLAALADLAASVDAFADLLVAEATLGVVKARPAIASTATTAAAGQAPPPSFEMVRTPRAGRVINTVAIAVLPDAAPPTDARPSPAATADPAVAAHIDDRSGDARGPAWTWTALDGAGQVVGTITLADVGLRPCDTVGLGAATLRDVVRDISGAESLEPTDPPGHAIARSWASALAGVPALAEDVGAGTDPTGAAATELRQRYERLRDAAVEAAADARAASAPAGTDDDRLAVLGRMARWGITPLAADGEDPTIGALADRVRRTAEVLERRLADLPADLPAGASLSELASVISALVAPEGPWPVFARIPAAVFAGLRIEPTTAGGAARLDPDWLEMVAPVRPALARLEALQLHERAARGGRPMRTWTNRPGDPWQTVAEPPSDTEVVRATRLVAAFGAPGVLPRRPSASTQGTVAVVVLDRFAETIPDVEQVNSAAFPHDLPTARAPQAVLLAVPPVVDEALTPAVIVDIVTEVRELARARMIDASAVGPATMSLHLAALPASGRAGVGLEGD